MADIDPMDPEALAKLGFTEAYDGTIGRIDLVGMPSNGVGFLLMKGDAATLLDHDTVAGLIKKEDTMTGAAPADPDVAAPVVKAEGDPIIEVADVIAETPAGSTADTVPGSPEWESKDAETAWNAAAVLTRIKAVLEWLAGREAQEAATTGEGYEVIWDLEDAGFAIDFAIDALSHHVVEEKLEAEIEQETIDAITKAVALLDRAALEYVEVASTMLAKAGRVLSAKNEGLLRDAAENLTKVLAALPSAPETIEKKEGVVTDTTTTADAVAPVEKSTTDEAPETTNTDTPEPVEKAAEAPTADETAELAKAEALQAVFDQDGKLVGAVKPSQLIPLEGGGTPSKPDADEPEASDLEPAPASEVGENAEAVPDAEPVEKGDNAAPADATEPSVAALVKSAEESDDPLIKQLGAALKAEHEDKALLLKSPVPGGPMRNGALPQPQQQHMRGQNAGVGAAPTADEVATLKKAMQEGGTPAEREAAANELTKLAMAEFTTRQPRADLLG